MPIASHFPYEPTTGQWMAVNMLDAFFESQQQVFVLQGYAGTGKTTLLKVVLDYLEDKDTTCRLMASTGRAARVLSLKTKRQAATIHSSIYQIDNKNSVIGEESKTIAFKLKDNTDPLKTVYFIDESSMIADKTEANTMLLFDDGRFLQHIFRYAGSRKIVFIGDTAQLPPVNCSFSAALDAEYLRKTYHRDVVSICLTEVKRQADESGIIHNATLLREQLFSSKIPPLSLDASNWDDLQVVPNIWVALGQYSNLINDKRMNALRIKFGYVITCHKSQGGEWPQVFLNIEPVLEKMTREMQYRWLYTAITRAAEKLVLPKHGMLY